jgi:hypothetical protein
MMQEHTNTKEKSKEIPKKAAQINPTEWKKKVTALSKEGQHSGKPSEIALIMGVSMATDPDQEQYLAHYQYGMSLQDLINSIRRLNPAPQKFITVITDYLHRHNLKIKALLDILSNQKANFHTMSTLLHYALSKARSNLDNTLETQSINPIFEELIKKAEKQAEEDALEKGAFWIKNHEAICKQLNTDNIEYHQYRWRDWYTSQEAKNQITNMKRLYRSPDNPGFKSLVDKEAKGFLDRVAWAPKQIVTVDHVYIGNVKESAKKIVDAQYQLFLDQTLLEIINQITEKPEIDLTERDVNSVNEAIEKLNIIITLVHDLIEELSKTYLIEEVASAPWFVSLIQSTGFMTYKKAMNPVFKYVLQVLKLNLPFIPYDFQRRDKIASNNIQSNQINLEAATTQIKKINHNGAGEADSDETLITEKHTNEEKDTSFDYESIQKILESKKVTFEKAVKPIKLFIDQEMESLDAADQAQRARDILRLIITHQNTPEQLIDEVAIYITQKGFIKSSSPEPHEQGHHYRTSNSSTLPSRFLATPRTIGTLDSSSYPQAKRLQKSPSPPSSRMYSFFKKRRPRGDSNSPGVESSNEKYFAPYNP